VGGVNLDQVEACGECAMGSGYEVGDDLVHPGAVESRGEWIGFVEADGGWSDGLPAAFRGRNGAGLLPRNGHARLAACMGELSAGVGAMLVKEGGDALEFGDVLVFPDAEIGRRDAAFGADGVGLSDNEPGTADGAAAEMDEVPVVGKSIDAGVFAHGRDGDTVWQSKAAELKRREEVIYRVGHIALDVAEKIWTDGFNVQVAFCVGFKGVAFIFGGFFLVFWWWICGEMRGDVVRR
jgi:hypothetical protein